MLIDKHARRPRRTPEYEVKTFYGQLQHIYVVRFTAPCRDLGLDGPSTIILAAIRNCILDDTGTDNYARSKLDIHYYSTQGALHIIDITCIQCLVGRMKDRDKWAIVDWSGLLARALYVADDIDIDRE